MTYRCVHQGCANDAAPHSSYCRAHAHCAFDPYTKVVRLPTRLRLVENRPADPALIEALTADGRVR